MKIKYFPLFLLLLASSFSSSAQEVHSSLYQEVVSMMKSELNYTYDSTSNRIIKPRPQIANDSSKTGLRESFVRIENRSPIVLIDYHIVVMDELDHYELSDTENIETLADKEALLYGNIGSKGVIAIKLKTD